MANREDLAATIAGALRVGLSYLSAAQEDQTSGVEEGLYDEAEGVEISARQSADEELIGQALEALTALTAERTVWIKVEGGMVGDVFTDDPTGLRYAVIDYDDEGAEAEDLHAVQQEDGSWATAYSHGGELTASPAPLVLPHPEDVDYGGAMVSILFANEDGEQDSAAFTVPEPDPTAALALVCEAFQAIHPEATKLDAKAYARKDAV